MVHGLPDPTRCLDDGLVDAVLAVDDDIAHSGILDGLEAEVTQVDVLERLGGGQRKEGVAR